MSKVVKAELRRLFDEMSNNNGDNIDIKALKLQLSSAPKFAPITDVITDIDTRLSCVEYIQ